VLRVKIAAAEREGRIVALSEANGANAKIAASLEVVSEVAKAIESQGQKEGYNSKRNSVGSRTANV
jgi:hypothetical protein